MYHTRGLWHTSAESSPTARACGTPSQMRLQKQKASTPLRNGSLTSRPMLRSLPQHPVNSHFYTYLHLFPGVVDTFSHTHTVRDTLIGSCTISEEEELTAPAISRPWLKPNEYYRGGDYIYKNLELSLRREVWRLDLSPLHISLGRLFPTVTVREESMLVPQICVYET